MSDSQPPPRIESVIEEVFQSPRFGLIPLHFATQRWPRTYRPFPSPAVLDMLHPGSHVKVLVTSIGDIKTQEAIWLKIMQFASDRHLGKHIGMVCSNTQRGQHHGLHMGMMIYFQMQDVIDIFLNRVETS